MKKKAFTLIEIVYCLIIVSFLYLIVMANIKTDRFNNRAMQANAHKAVSAFNEASIKLRDSDNENCHNGFLIEDVAGDEEFAIVNDDGSTPDAKDIIDIYGKYIRFVKKDFDFCDMTPYCKEEDIGDKGSIQGALLPGNVVVGVEVFDDLEDCPDYYDISTKESLTGHDKCWGKLYVDTNAEKTPNKLNSDVYVFGLDKNGVQQ